MVSLSHKVWPSGSLCLTPSHLLKQGRDARMNLAGYGFADRRRFKLENTAGLIIWHVIINIAQY
jgi:hypothetical protein